MELQTNKKKNKGLEVQMMITHPHQRETVSLRAQRSRGCVSVTPGRGAAAEECVCSTSDCIVILSASVINRSGLIMRLLKFQL